MTNIYTEQLIKARRIDPSGSASLPIHRDKIAIQTGPSFGSSIKQVEHRETFQPGNRPKLAEPEISIMSLLANTLVEQEELTKTATQNLRHDLEILREQVSKNRIDRTEALEKEAEASRSRSTWSVLSKVAGYFSVGSLGAMAATSSSPYLAAVAVVELTRQLSIDTNADQTMAEWLTKSEGLQQKFKKVIHAGAFAIETGLFYAAWQTGALSAVRAAVRAAPVNEAIKKAGTLISTGSSMMSYATNFGMSIYDKKAEDLKALLKRNSGSTTLLNQEISDQMATFRTDFEIDQSNMEVIQEAGTILNRVSRTE